MRDRVARTDTRSVRALATNAARATGALAVLPTLLLLVSAQAAAAEGSGDAVAADPLTSGLVAPVGIGAVLIGFGGLVIGLLRRRRIATARAAVAASRGLNQRQPAGTGDRVS